MTSSAHDAEHQRLVEKAKEMKRKGYSNSYIAHTLLVGVPRVRALLREES